MDKRNKSVAIRKGHQPRGSNSSPDKPPSNAPHLVSSVVRNGADRSPAPRPTTGSASHSSTKK